MRRRRRRTTPTTKKGAGVGPNKAVNSQHLRVLGLKQEGKLASEPMAVLEEVDSVSFVKEVPVPLRFLGVLYREVSPWINNRKPRMTMQSFTRGGGFFSF